MTVLVDDDGSEDNNYADLDWEDSSSCACAKCNQVGLVRDFKPKKPTQPEGDGILDDSRDYELATDCTGIWLTVKKMSVHVFKTDEGVVADIYAIGHEMDEALGSTYVFDSEAENEDTTEEAERKNAEGLNDGEGYIDCPDEKVVPGTDEAELHRAELLGLKQFDVTIKATVTKTYRVNAEDEDKAVEESHGFFSVLNDDTPEDYEEETLHVEEIKTA